MDGILVLIEAININLTKKRTQLLEVKLTY